MKSDSQRIESSSGLWVISGSSQMSSPLFSGLPIRGTSGPQKISAALPNLAGTQSATAKFQPQRLRSTKPSKRLERLRTKAYRSAIAKENAVTRIALQIRLMREHAGLTQKELAERIGTKQGSIARLESMSYGKFSISMLQKIADYFDVVAWVEFAPYSSFLRRTANLSAKAITPQSYSEEFDKDGQPSIDLMLRMDGSAICQSHYVSAGAGTTLSWHTYIESTSSATVYK